MNITAYANDVLSRYWDGTLPVNPLAIANNMGVRVLERDPMEVSGFYDHENKTIYVRAPEPMVRKRFTVAHELGHHVLGHGSSPRDTSRIHDVVDQRKEFAANLFAADLLMPYIAVRYYVEKRNMQIDELTRTFQVSFDAMRIRLERFGFI